MVSRVLANMGYAVYDCDGQAKRLMNEDASLKTELIALLGSEAYAADGRLNRPYVSSRIFRDSALLEQINSVVHPAVKADIQRWSCRQKSQTCVFVETALLHESGLDALCDAVWHVTAPEPLRVARVMRRNQLPRQQVEERMNSQRRSAELQAGEYEIVNDDTHAVVPQIVALLREAENKL